MAGYPMIPYASLCCAECAKNIDARHGLFQRGIAAQSEVDAVIALYRCSIQSKRNKLLPILLHVAAAHPDQFISDALISALPQPDLVTLEQAEDAELKLSAKCVLFMFEQAEKVAKVARGKAKERPLTVANLLLPSSGGFRAYGDRLALMMISCALQGDRHFVPVHSGASFRQFWRSLSDRKKIELVVLALQGLSIGEMQVLSPLMRVDIRGEVTEQSWILSKLQDRPLLQALRANWNYRPYRVTYRHVAEVIKRFWESPSGSRCSVNLELLYDFYVFMSFWYMVGYGGDKKKCGSDELEELVKLGFKIREKLEIEQRELTHLRPIARWWGYWSPLLAALPLREDEEIKQVASEECDGEAFVSDSD